MQTAGPALERKAEIAAFLTDLEPRIVFFVDEIHRLPRAVEETFYPAMEDGQLPITLGVGAGAKVVTLDLPPFTLIGATTRAGLLTTPLRDRFGIQHRLDHYGPDDLAAIVVRSAKVLNIADPPRRRARDRRAQPRHPARRQPPAQARARLRAAARRRQRSTPAPPTTRSTCSRSTTRAWTGWTARSSPRSANGSAGGPVGLSTLAVAVQEEQDTIEDVYEPYLLQRGFLTRTPRGRCATPHAFRHLGLEPPPQQPQGLF